MWNPKKRFSKDKIFELSASFLLILSRFEKLDISSRVVGNFAMGSTPRDLTQFGAASHIFWGG